VKFPARLSTFLLALSLPWLGPSCETAKRAPSEPQTPEPSPNASILPAPLASAVETKVHRPSAADAGAVADSSVDASAPPTLRWLREDEPVDADTVPRPIVSLPREASARDASPVASGVRLLARLRWLDLPSFPRMPEANNDALQKLKEALAFDLIVDLSPTGRMRVRLDSDAFVLPRGSELRSRQDRLGHVLTWDGASKYTVLPAGTLRAALSEHRPDNVPLVKPKLTAAGTGNVQGIATDKIELSTPLGRLILDEASIPSAGSSGRLLCRMLGELIAADPLSSLCERERSLVPVRAELFTRAGGHLAFEVLKIERDRPLDTETLLVPPPEARFVPQDLPGTSSSQVPSDERLRELRLRPLVRSEKPEPTAPKQGLIVQNRSDVLRYVVLDGVVLARVPARAELRVDSLLPGKYALVTLDFLGDDPTPLRMIELPARVAIGEEADSAR
jgi:hypothetical protein